MNPGTNLDGYRVLALVGRGGNAEVYRVHHIDLNVDRALKVPLHVDAAGRERLVREAQIQSRLRHTNLVTVFDLVAVDGVPALVMDYVGGGTLADLIARRKIPLEEVDSIFRQICSGVAVAHAAGLVHRDIKPANVLVEEGSAPLHVRVADFGLSGLAAAPVQGGSGATLDSGGIGTILYAAPELSTASASADPRADVFSLGCILYELCTGRHPFASQSALGSLRKIRAGAWPRPLFLPSRLVQIMEACLQPDPTRRPPDAGAVLAMLGTPPQRRWRIAAAGVGVTALAALALVDRPPVSPNPQISEVVVATAVTDPKDSTSDMAGGAIPPREPSGMAVPSSLSSADPIVNLLPSQIPFETAEDTINGRLYALLPETNQVDCARRWLQWDSQTLVSNEDWVSPNSILCGDHVVVRTDGPSEEAVVVSGCGRGRSFHVVTASKEIAEDTRLTTMDLGAWLMGSGLKGNGAGPRREDPWARSDKQLVCPVPQATLDLSTVLAPLNSGKLYPGPPQEIIDVAYSLLLTAAGAFYLNNVLTGMNNADFQELDETYLRVLKSMPWLATFAEKDESGADLLLRVVALGGEDRGRQFVLSMKEGEPREVSRLDEDQVEEQMSRPHLGGLAEDAPAGTSE